MLSDLELTGRIRTHITQLEDPRCALHHDAVAPFLSLRAQAAQVGIELVPHSSFRDFDTQVLIWNRKFRGERPLYDRGGRLIDTSALSDEQKVDAILLWSALPGTSRHHWGSEIDVIDSAAVSEGYRVQLLPEEYSAGGVFARLAGWLDEHLAASKFFRPYDRDRGGVSPEPWHLSYAPVSRTAQLSLTPGIVADALRQSDLLGLDIVLSRLSDIHQRYALNVATPPPLA